MNARFDFFKLSGSGNDFICIDNRTGWLDGVIRDCPRAERFAREMCSRGFGVGADGLVIAIQPAVGGVAKIGALFFEPDGSQSELCGNGTGCFIRCTLENGWAEGPEVSVLTSAGVVLGKAVDDPYIRVCIPLPDHTASDVSVKVGETNIACDVAVTGVPHAITYVDDVDLVDMPHLGPLLRRHPDFGPRGINANFVQVLEPGRLALRTWEFGVEGETLACGTGAAAAAIMAVKRFGWDGPIRRGEQPVLVQSRGGDVLRVYSTFNDAGSVVDLCVDTVVRQLYRGRTDPALVARAIGT
ncbi:MAG: diaminopimelate epimerase [Planctomycetaceae bacterium]|nr:diaminopimelate epimerase [Planctomycetaceae bacterium]